MNIQMVLLVILGILMTYGIGQAIELKKFRVTPYEMTSEKVNQELKLAVLSDLHYNQFGKNNERLFRAVSSEQPDLILVPGDLVVDQEYKKFDYALDTVRELAKTAPVYFSRGNHESRVVADEGSKRAQIYAQVEQAMRDCGCHILSNQGETIEIGGEKIRITGLELNLLYYTKGVKIGMLPDYMTQTLGRADEKNLQILLAHNPAYSPWYAKWGADLTVSGHNHGGLVCIPGIGSIISPQFEWFPKYGAGFFDIEGRKVAVSRGLGTHTFHVRIFNRAEILMIRVKPGKA